MKKFILGAAAAVATTFGAANAVVLELALGVDVSGSIDTTEFNLQRDAYVAAFQSQTVKDAIEASAGGVAVNFFYWATTPVQTIGWTLLQTAADADAFAAAIAAAARPNNVGASTGIARAIDLGVNGLLNNAFSGQRLVLDISGDGQDNVNGTAAVQAARNNAAANGVTINGLAIDDAGSTAIFDYYTDNVKTVDGFVLGATFDTFQTAIIRKINAEIRDEDPVIPLPAPAILMLSGLAGVMGWKRKKAA